MQLKITHTTEHTYDKPIRFGLQHLRMTPKSRDGQRVLDWTITITGGQAEAEFEDQHNNHVTLVGFPVGAEQITIVGAGTVEVEDRSGVVGVHGGYAPLWYFDRITPLTRAGPEVRRLARDVGGTGDLDCLHALSAKISEIVTYTIGETGVETTAEDALKAGVGVCQDHAHVFISAARLMGRPARYVSGYLLIWMTGLNSRQPMPGRRPLSRASAGLGSTRQTVFHRMHAMSGSQRALILRKPPPCRA